MNDIQTDAQWIPLDANVRADLLSSFVDKDDFQYTAFQYTAGFI